MFEQCDSLSRKKFHFKANRKSIGSFKIRIFETDLHGNFERFQYFNLYINFLKNTDTF